MFYTACMDWELAIKRNREPLLRIVATLFALIGLSEGATVERLKWSLYRRVLRVLRPAEAAVRRLIVIVAHNMVAKPFRPRPTPAKRASKGKARGRVSFKLIERRPQFDAAYARFWNEGPKPNATTSAAEKPDTVSAGPLCRRLLAIKGALEDLTAQARRYARWRARPVAERKPPFASILRSGPAPKFRNKPAHEVHGILTECHWLARNLPEPDTS